MNGFYAQQNTPCAAKCDVSSAARFYAFVLLLLGVAVAAPIFVILRGGLLGLVLLPMLIVVTLRLFQPRSANHGPILRCE